MAADAPTRKETEPALTAILEPSWLTASTDTAKVGEPAPGAAKKDASEAAGIKHADRNATLYEDMLHSGSRLPLEPGRHPKLPADGTASYIADAKGRVIEFTTAKGTTYKNIKYDSSDNVMSYDAPSGHHFVRSPHTDQDGFGTWSCYDAQGRQVMYAGSNSYSWRGKVTADDSTFSTMIGSGPNKGRLISRHADGTALESKLIERTAKGGVLQTTVVLPDGTQVVRDSKLAGGDTTAELAAEQKATADKAAAGQAGDKAKKIADKMLQKIGDNPDAIAELSSALKNTDHLKSATITRLPNGKHQVNMHFDQGMTMPAINANVRGFRPGRLTWRPTSVLP